jgi:hypothetical protein
MGQPMGWPFLPPVGDAINVRCGSQRAPCAATGVTLLFVRLLITIAGWNPSGSAKRIFEANAMRQTCLG